MRRNTLTSIGALTCGLVLAVGTAVGVTPASAAPSSTDLQSTVQAVQNAAAAAAAQATGAAAATAPAPASNPLPSVPASVAAPISVLSNELGTTALPNQDSTTGTNSTGQSSPVANANAPINACSLSVGVAADASSGCSTTSVGVNEPGGVADANVPITAQDNAIGLLNEAATALGLASGQSSASTTQDGTVNADAPVSICSVNVGLAANTSSNCGTTGTSGPSSQTGVVDAEVPVGVCDVIAEVDGDSSSNCPQQSDPVTQQGQAADVFVPVTACGAIVEVDGSANGMCMPDAGFPLANDLPTSDASQSAPVDAVVPVNACSVVVAVDGSGSNSCEPSHVGTTTTGAAPVSAPVTLCAVTAALDGASSGTCEGAGATFAPIGSRGEPRERRDRSGDHLWHSGCPQRQRGRFVPAADHGGIDVDPYARRRNAGLVLVRGHADTGVVGLQPFAGQHADRRNGGLERLVVGVDGRTTPARGVDRAGFAGRGPGRQPFGPPPFGPRGRCGLGAVSGSSRRAVGGRGPCSPIGMLVTPEAWRTSFDRATSGEQPARWGVGGSPVPTSARMRSSPRSSAGLSPPSLGAASMAKGSPDPWRATADTGRRGVRRPRCQSNPGRSSPPVAVRGQAQSTRRRGRRDRPTGALLVTG